MLWKIMYVEKVNYDRMSDMAISFYDSFGNYINVATFHLTWESILKIEKLDYKLVEGKVNYFLFGFP